MAPNKKFGEGKYGLASAGTQVTKAMNYLKYLTDEMDEQKSMEMATFGASNYMSFKGNHELSYPKSMNGYSFDQEFRTPEAAEQSREKVIQFRKDYQELINKPENKLIKDTFYGYHKMVDKMLDTESGDFGIAMGENPYLSVLAGQFINGPRVNKTLTVEKVNENLGKDGFLTSLNDFFSATADLVDREYERQQITENYSPEAEKDYLAKLSADFQRLIDAQAGIAKHVRPDGTSPYDEYMQQKPDTMVFNDVTSSISMRTCIFAVEDVKGQKQAIENGWGMNELKLMGAVYAQTMQLEKDVEYLVIQSSETNLKKLREEIENKIEFSKKSLAEAQNKLTEEQKKYNDLVSKNPNPDNKAKQEIQKAKDAVDSALKNVDYYKNQVKENNQSLAELPKKEENLKKQLVQAVALKKEFDRLKDEFAHTKVTNAFEKSLLSQKANNLFEKVLKAPDYVAKQAEGRYQQVKLVHEDLNPLKTEPMEYDKNFVESTFSKEDYESFNYLFMSDSVLAATATAEAGMEGHFPKQKADITNHHFDAIRGKRTEDLNIIVDPKHGKTNDIVSFKYRPYTREEDANEREIYENHLRTFQHFTNKIALEATGTEKNFVNYIKAVSSLLDVDNGNYLQALDENAFLIQFNSIISGGGPDIYLKKGKSTSEQKMDVDLESVNDHTLEEGTRNAILDFYDAGVDIFKVEYAKQRDMKTGWNALKERNYLAKLDESYEKTIRAFEELERVPQEYQENDKYYGNTLSMHTGRKVGEGRDCYREINGLRWQRIAIQNGWCSRDLAVMDAVGNFEGGLNKVRMQNSIAIEKKQKLLAEEKDEKKRKEYTDAIEKLENENKKYDEWEEKNFKPLKEYLVNRKIEKPADAMEAISFVHEFVKNHKLESELNASCSVELRVADKYVIPKAYNDALKEHQENKKYGGVERKPISFVTNDSTKKMKELIDSMHLLEKFPRSGLKNMGAAYLRDAFLNGLNKNAHPEIFSENNPEYPVWNKKIDEYVSQYSERLLEYVRLKDTSKTDENMNAEDIRTFTDMLQHGDHSVFFSEMRDKIKAEAKLSLLEEFKAGREKRAENDPSLAEALEEMENSKANAFSGSKLYSDIKTDLAAVEKMRNKFSRELDDAMQTSMEEELITDVDYYEGTEKQRVGFTAGKTAFVDPKEFKEYLDIQMRAYNRMEAYLAGKNKLIAEKGGKKGEASVLGVNGERRYKAVLSARNSLRNQIRTAGFFNNDGLSAIERDRINAPDFSLNREKYKNAIDYKYDIETERVEFEKNMKYSLIRENKLHKNALDECLEKEDRLRTSLSIQYKSATDEAEKRELESKIVNSAERTLYLGTLKDMVKSAEDRVLKNGLSVNAVKNVKMNELVDLSTKVKLITRNGVEFGKDGVKFKENAEQYKAFKESVINKSPLLDSFRVLVVEGAKEGNLSTQEINKMQNRIVSDFQANNKAPKVEKPEKAPEMAPALQNANPVMNGPK